MKVQMMSVESVKPYVNNPRNNDGGVDAVANSIKEFGWQQPIVVDKDNIIIVGHTRLLAAKKLKLKQVPVVVADSLTPEQVKAYRLADNKTNELTDWDEDLLDEELTSIIDLDMTDFGFTPFDLDGQQKPEKKPNQLNNDFVVPPFSVIDLGAKTVLDRKRLWTNIIKDRGIERDATVYANSFKEAKGYQNNYSMPEVSIMNPVVCEIINRWFLPNDGNKCNTFDCFAGDTEFGFVSSYLGNHFTGIELRQKQADFNQSRVDDYKLDAHYICDDGQKVGQHLDEESQDLLFSCPPYFDLEKYSDNPNDASNQDTYEDFIKILDNAFSAACKCLKNNRFACIVVGNIRDKNGFYYSFVDDIVKIFKNSGLHFYNDIILKTPNGTAPFRARNTMKYRKVVKTHQNLLVFYKGDDFKNLADEYSPIEGLDKVLGVENEGADI